MNSLVKTKLFELINGIESTTERQYGGGLDDAYMNRRSAFAPPDVNSAFASPMSQDGLPTIYRNDGGDFNYFDADAADAAEITGQDDADDAAELGISTNDFDQYNIYEAAPATAPAPQGGNPGSDVDFGGENIGFQVNSRGGLDFMNDGAVDPNFDYAGSGLESYAEIKARLDGNRPDDGYTKVESTYLNDIMAKTGMTITDAENYLASMMATPGGIAAMNQGFYGDYTGGGPAGTLDNFARGLGDNLGVQGIFNRDKKNKKEEEEFRAGYLGVEPSIFSGIKDTVSRYFKGSKGLETPAGIQEFEDALESEGSTFEPIQESTMQSAFGMANSLLNPMSGIAGILEFLTGATPLGIVTSKEGVRFALDTTGALTPEAFLMNAEVDYGNEATPERRRRPVQQKTISTTEDKPLTGMAALLARRSKPTSRLELDDKASGQDKFEKIYNRRYRNI